MPLEEAGAVVGSSAQLPAAALTPQLKVLESDGLLRTRRLLHRLLSGERLKVAAVGGSVTWGKEVEDREATAYGALVTTWLQHSFPKAALTFINA